MKSVVAIVAVLAAFVLGVIVGWPLRERKRTAMEQFMHSVQSTRGTANLGVDILDSLQSGAPDKAQRRAAQSVAVYYTMYSSFDSAPDKKAFVQRIESLRDKSAPLKRAIEEVAPPKANQ